MNHTDAIARQVSQATIAKSTLMNAKPILAKTDPPALTALTATLANASLDMTEKTAKTTSMNALRSHAKTVAHARISLPHTPVNALRDSKEITAKLTSMSALSLLNLTCQLSLPPPLSHLPDHLPDPLSTEDEEDEDCKQLHRARMEVFAVILLMITSAIAPLDSKERIAKPTLTSALWPLAKTAANALTASTAVCAHVLLDFQENTAEPTLTNVNQTLAKTVLNASTASTNTLAFANPASPVIIAKRISMSAHQNPARTEAHALIM
jgi:hypothetical protein